MDTLKNTVQSGNVSDVMNLFHHKTDLDASPVAQTMQGNLIERLMQKFGLSNGQAGGIASSIIPAVLRNLMHKTNDPNDNSFNLSSILGHLGGSNFDVGSVLNKFGGNDNKERGGITDSLKIFLVNNNNIEHTINFI